MLDYAAPAYGSDMIYRFADFNAGRYASRNAAFQRALGVASARTLDLDGDLIAADGAVVGQTEAAARSIGPTLGLSDVQIRRELQRGNSADFDDSVLLREVLALAETRSGKLQPRATLPQIDLHSPKITRRLTTEWFAKRVQQRFERCLARAAA